MKIQFRKKSQPEWLLLFIFALPFFLSFLLELLRIPSVIKYSLDVAWLCILFFIVSRKIRFSNAHIRRLANLVLIFLFSTLIGVLMNFQSALYYLWGLRNNFRYFVFFFGCVFFLRERGFDNMMKFIDVIFWINFLISLFQFFVLGKSQDFLGGVFGTQIGCNSYTNILFIIVISYSIVRHIQGQEKLSTMLLKSAIALLLSVLSELKIFFIELILIVGIAVLLVRFSFKRMFIMLGISLGAVFGAQLIGVLFPSFAGWFRMETMLDVGMNATYGTSLNAVNRLSAVPVVWDQFLDGFWEKLFGLGLGNCDHSAFQFLVTPFYKSYNSTRYMWFSSSFMILETGIVGLSLYTIFFVLVFIEAGKLCKEKQRNPVYCHLAQIMAVLSCVMIVYNSALRTEAGYIVYFVLALPFVQPENNKGYFAANMSGSQRKVYKLWKRN